MHKLPRLIVTEVTLNLPENPLILQRCEGTWRVKGLENPSRDLCEAIVDFLRDAAHSQQPARKILREMHAAGWPGSEPVYPWPPSRAT